MQKRLTFTFDLEDHRPDPSLPERYNAVMDDILEFWDEQKIKATVFTVGALAEKDPKLIKKIHERGHEIAHHSYDHTTLDKQSPKQFLIDTKRGKDILENITGEPVKGYRAPVFSLTRKTLWALDIIKELGFSYSSSVLPTANPLHGMPGVPDQPFRWSNGLIEIPAPIGQFFSAKIPYLGGFYFRYLPTDTIKKNIANAPEKSVLWTYFHPYDFDHQEKNWRIKGASPLVSALLWCNRKNTFKKLKNLSRNYQFTGPIRTLALETGLPVVNGSTL